MSMPMSVMMKLEETPFFSFSRGRQIKVVIIFKKAVKWKRI